MTGRCAFTDGCEGWETGCQKCPTFSDYPPMKIGKAHQQLSGRRQILRATLALGYQFISPSQYVIDVLNSLYGAGCCRIIGNGIDVTAEITLDRLPAMPAGSGRPKIAVMAYDLRYDGKTNQQLVRMIAAFGEKIGPYIFGKFSPFVEDNVINHGSESDKRTLTSVLNQIDGSMFNPCADNYPLALCEALSTGVPVIVTRSDVTQEMLAKSGGKTFDEVDVLRLVQLKKLDAAWVVLNVSLIAFNQRSRVAYSGQQMLEEYVSFHRNLQLSGATAALFAG